MGQTTGKKAESQPRAKFEAPRVVGESSEMRKLKSMVETVAARQCTLLVQGESGSGKELIVRHVHACSRRRNNPFIAVDCSTLRDTLLESELFGHVKGSFTGAERDTLGFVRAADGGTLFLDEIGEMAIQVQAKLLRVIQERVVVPVGSIDPIPVNVRIVAATHRDLKKMVRDGDFRQDLFYRLNVVNLVVPPLRDRREDIVPLAKHLLSQLSEFYEEPEKTFAKESLDALQMYDWPGNIRELTNAIEHAYVLGEEEVLTVKDLPESVRSVVTEIHAPEDAEFPTLAGTERALLIRSLREAKGNQTQAARLLDIDRHRLARMLRRYKLETMSKS